MSRLRRVLRLHLEQIVYGGLTLTLLIVGYLVAVEARGEPVRSRTVLLLLIAFAFLAGWLHEFHRPGGTYDLQQQLDARSSSPDADDRR